MRSNCLAMLAATLTSVTVGVGYTAAAAASPPSGWTNERILACDGEEVRTYLSPAGFGSPFHVVNSADVIVPKYVTITVEGETFVTRDVPGFDHTSPHAVHCSYVDPAGLHVDFIGLRT